MRARKVEMASSRQISGAKNDGNGLHAYHADRFGWVRPGDSVKMEIAN